MAINRGSRKAVCTVNAWITSVQWCFLESITRLREIDVAKRCFKGLFLFFFSSSFFFKVFYLGKQEKDRSKDVTRIIIREFIFSIRVYTNVFKNFVINIVLTKLYEFNI